MRRSVIMLASLAALAGGCASRQASQVVVPVKPATDQQRAALLDEIKKLEGTWEMPGDNGGMQVASVFSVTSSGSAVREVMFPGTPHEMTNMYTMDGPTLLMTHYCAVGNQPRLRAKPGVPGQIAFTLDGVSNMTSPDQVYMGKLRLVMIDHDHLRAEWQSLKRGNTEGDPTIFELTRKN